MDGLESGLLSARTRVCVRVPDAEHDPGSEGRTEREREKERKNALRCLFLCVHVHLKKNKKRKKDREILILSVSVSASIISFFFFFCRRRDHGVSRSVLATLLWHLFYSPSGTCDGANAAACELPLGGMHK